MNNSILVTGGAGYIGSHATLCLLQAGYEVVVLDNLVNSSRESLRRVERICGRAPSFCKGDVRDRVILDEIFSKNKFSAVLHFAGLKSVGESCDQPRSYYDNNVSGSIALCEAMEAAGVFTLVFSSSATVYGEPEIMPIREDFPTPHRHPSFPTVGCGILGIRTRGLSEGFDGLFNRAQAGGAAQAAATV